MQWWCMPRCRTGHRCRDNVARRAAISKGTTVVQVAVNGTRSTFHWHHNVALTPHCPVPLDRFRPCPVEDVGARMLTTTTAAADIVMFQNSGVRSHRRGHTVQKEAHTTPRTRHFTVFCTRWLAEKRTSTSSGGDSALDTSPPDAQQPRSKPPPETASELQSVLITHLSTEGMHKLHGQRCRAVEHRNIRTSAADAGPERDRHGQLRNSHGGVCLASANTNPASSPTPAWMQCSRNAQ